MNGYRDGYLTVHEGQISIATAGMPLQLRLPPLYGAAQTSLYSASCKSLRRLSRTKIPNTAAIPIAHQAVVFEKRAKVELVMKVKEEEKQGGESAFVSVVSRQPAFGDAGGGGGGGGGDESDAGVGDAYCGCRYSRNPIFNIFLNASYYETQHSAPAKVVPIAALYPGYYGNWAIRGRVVSKIEVRSYVNRNGTGTYFWFEMKDDAGGEVRVVCFTREVDMFYGKVVEGMELVLSRGRLQRPKDDFNPQGRRCEIILQYNSTIQAIPGTGSSSPQGKANATPQAPEGKAPVIGMQCNAAPQEEVERKKPVENPVQDETLAVKARNELLLKKVAALEKNYEVVSSQALESSTQLQDCKARLEELETWVKERKRKAQAS